MSQLFSFGHRDQPPEPEQPPPWQHSRDEAPFAARGEGAERRRHLRIPLGLRGRYMLEGGRDYPCVTRDVSRMGMSIQGVPSARSASA